MSTNNLITPRGIQRVQWELEWLSTVERPRVVNEVAYAASLGDRSENAEYLYGKRRLRQIDSRVDFLVRSLDRVQVVDPAAQSGDRVRFGATVTLADEEGDEKTFHLYGEHEVDVEAGILSHKSPLAMALMGRRPGDEVRFQAPGGVRDISLVEVRFLPQAPDPVPAWKQERAEGG
jgi:transcription elongation factor GreB